MSDAAAVLAEANVWASSWSLLGFAKALSMGLLLAAFGCSSPASREDDHLSHETPPHQPADFMTATDELERRSPHATASLGSRPSMTSAEAAIQMSELKDIVRWLPELAADTRLKKAEWERVQAASIEMQTLLDASASLSEATSDAKARASRYGQIVAELQTLAAEARKLDGAF